MLEIERSSGTESDYGWPRLINLVIGFWLFASAFVWPHAAHMRWVAVVVGISIVLVSTWAMFVHAVHWANLLLAAILVVSTVGHAYGTLTVWNHVIVSVAVFALALVPAGWQLIHRTTSRAAHSGHL